REHIRHGSVTDERRSLKQKDPQPERVEAEIARRRRWSSLTAPLRGMLGRPASSAAISASTAIPIVFQQPASWLVSLLAQLHLGYNRGQVQQQTTSMWDQETVCRESSTLFPGLE